jgi:hypothetical protein
MYGKWKNTKENDHHNRSESQSGKDDHQKENCAHDEYQVSIKCSEHWSERRSEHTRVSR